MNNNININDYLVVVGIYFLTIATTFIVIA